MFSFFEELPNYFPKQLYQFSFLPAIYGGSNVSTSSPKLVIVCPFYYSPPSGCEVYLVVLICFSLMTNDVRHYFLSYWLFIIFCPIDYSLENAYLILCSFLSWVHCFLSCKSSSYIPNTRTLSDIWLSDIFSYLVASSLSW